MQKHRFLGADHFVFNVSLMTFLAALMARMAAITSSGWPRPHRTAAESTRRIILTPCVFWRSRFPVRSAAWRTHPAIAIQPSPRTPAPVYHKRSGGFGHGIVPNAPYFALAVAVSRHSPRSVLVARYANRAESALGGGHHVHPHAWPVRLSGGDPGRLVAACRRLLGVTPHRCSADHRGAPCGAGAPATVARVHSPHQQRQPVRLVGLSGGAGQVGDAGVDEQTGQSLRQRPGRCVPRPSGSSH